MYRMQKFIIVEVKYFLGFRYFNFERNILRDLGFFLYKKKKFRYMLIIRCLDNISFKISI